MLYTLASLTVSAVASLLFLAASIHFGFLVQSRRLPLNAVQNTSAAQTPDPMYQVLAQRDIFYRLFGVSITWQLTAVLIILAVAVFLCVFYMLSGRLAKEIQLIEKAVGQLSGGDFNVRLNTDLDGELSDIASGINLLAEHVQNMQQMAEEAERTKNELITDVAHDLRTPLTSVIGYIDLVRQSGADMTEAQKEKYLDIAYTKAEKLRSLTEDLFSLTKIGYGQMPMQMTRIDLISLLAQTVDEFYPVFEENRLVCTYEPDVRNCLIEADGSQLYRVFDNLLSNAVRYGSKGKSIRIFTVTGQDQIVVHVVNYGNIIPQESIPRLFDKFYKVDQSRNSESGGTGLGLAIAKSIVESHGGRIGVSSGFEGTDFYVVLPLIQSAANNKC